MPQKRRFSHQPKKTRRTDSAPPPVRETVVYEKKAPVQYGKPFIVMEDTQKKTFVYTGSSWVPHTMSIAECRQSCQVNELPQKVNRMTRYEVRCPVE